MYETGISPSLQLAFSANQSPLMVICRADFLSAVARCWETAESITGGQQAFHPTYGPSDGLSLEKLKRVCSFDDMAFNAAMAWNALSCQFFEGLDVNLGLPMHNEFAMPAEIMNGGLAQYNQEVIIDYFYGRNLGYSVVPNPVDDQYKLLAKGRYLFVGIEPGFVATMEDRDKQKEFLTNCLEMCRTTMQSPALFESPLYRRFVFTNVNV